VSNSLDLRGKCGLTKRIVVLFENGSVFDQNEWPGLTKVSGL